MHRTMKILALTFGDRSMASTQYRLAQFETWMKAEGIELTLLPAAGFKNWASLRDYNLVIVQKKLLRGSAVNQARKHAHRLAYDTDDAIWEPHGRRHFWWTRVRTNWRLRKISSAADVCTVANDYLASRLRQSSSRVEIVPMALDGTVWHPQADRPPGPIRIGWAGAPPNLMYLMRIEPALAEVQKLRPNIELVVYCGEPPKWELNTPSRYMPFKAGTEAEVVRGFDIGLLPLPDNPFAAGKSPIKALQYAACGIPCVAAPVGATLEIVRDGETGLLARSHAEWRDGLLRLIDDAAERARIGGNARRLFLENHEHKAVAARLAGVWRDAVRSA